ncbi:MAG TPA: hypothetical protein EYP56_14530, partial [Planctomycetaceae bacterium]|nr:hypothetical protein [Planctomycetaceae bacterium]
MSIQVTAPHGYRWREGAYEVWVLERGCRLKQGESSASAERAVLWIDRERAEPGQAKVLAYLDGHVDLRLVRDGRRAGVTDRTWFGRFYTRRGVTMEVARIDRPPEPKPAIYETARQQTSPDVGGEARGAAGELAEPTPGGLP